MEKDKEIPSLIGWKVKLDDLNQSFSDNVIYEDNGESIINSNTNYDLEKDKTQEDTNQNSVQSNQELVSEQVDTTTPNSSTPLNNTDWKIDSTTQEYAKSQSEKLVENPNNKIQNNNERSWFFKIPECVNTTNDVPANNEDHDFDNSTAGSETKSQWNIVLDNLGSSINTEAMTTINVNSEKFQATEPTNWETNQHGNWDTNDWEHAENSDSIPRPDLQEEWDGVNLWKIEIDNWDAELTSNLFDLSGWSLYDSQKGNHVRTGKITVISVLISIIAIAIGVVCFFYNRFITTDLANPEWNRAYTFIETAKDFVWKYTNTSTDVIESINLNWENWKSELDKLISSDLNYLQKRDILTTALSNLSNNIVWKYSTLNWIRTDITQYWFFPKTLTSIISEDEPISSIQNSLIALEAIKFSSAISVFSYLDTFVSSLVQSLWMDKNAIEENIEKVTNRWETDINVYIKDCYLNPYESDYDCNYIWDFDEYYNNLKDNFNTKFFKELIKYTDARLEQSQIPSFSISFKEFNQNSNEITFDIEINTLKEDEAQLTKKWILSPHIFIFKSLINSLRQSRFIVWDDISIKTLEVTPSTYIIWASEVNVNKSSNSFTVHIKKENAVEIDDFVYMDY